MGRKGRERPLKLAEKLLSNRHEGLKGQLRWLPKEKRYHLALETGVVDESSQARYRVNVEFEPETPLTDLGPHGKVEEFRLTGVRLLFMQSQGKKIQVQIKN